MEKSRERERLAVAKLKGEGRIESEYYRVQGFVCLFVRLFFGMMKIFCSEIMQMVAKSCDYINTKNQWLCI